MAKNPFLAIYVFLTLLTCNGPQMPILAITCPPKYNDTVPSEYGSRAEKTCSDEERVSNGLQVLRSECGIGEKWTPPLTYCKSGTSMFPLL